MAAPLTFKVSDDAIALTAGVGKDWHDFELDFHVAAVLASLRTAQVAGSLVTVDLKVAGVSIFSTPVTVDNGKTSSRDAATPAVISNAVIPAGSRVMVDVPQVGDGSAAGLRVHVFGCYVSRAAPPPSPPSPPPPSPPPPPPPSGCGCTPAYVTGNRTAAITVTASANTLNPSYGAGNLVDGSLSDGTTPGATVFKTPPPPSVSGLWIKFSFAALTKITEAIWRQRDANISHGIWKWQGSVDDITYVDIGLSFTLGGATDQVQDSLAGNTEGYLHYRLIGVSGAASNLTWLREIEFKQCVC